MSQRGSFVTQYIYCDKCFQAAKKVLLAANSELCSTTIPNWSTDGGPELPIIAGKVGHQWSEAHAFEQEILPELNKVICHPLRVAIIEEGGTSVYANAKTILAWPKNEFKVFTQEQSPPAGIDPQPASTQTGVSPVINPSKEHP